MYNNNIETLIDFKFERDVETGEFTVEVLAASKEVKETFILEDNVVYLSTPTEGKVSYLFKIREHGLYYFTLLKDEVNATQLLGYTKVDFHIILGEAAEYTKLLGKILNRALVTDDQADVLYLNLKAKLNSEEAFE